MTEHLVGMPDAQPDGFVMVLWVPVENAAQPTSSRFQVRVKNMDREKVSKLFDTYIHI